MPELALWPHQVRGIEEAKKNILAGVRRQCVTSPTGGGKTKMMVETIDWAQHALGWKTALYTNRRMLTEQMIRMLNEHEVEFGVRASGYDDYERPLKPVQICSSPTENARVFNRRKRAVEVDGREPQWAREHWKLHDATLVIIDELHMQRGEVIQKLVDEHVEEGAFIVAFTATPLGVSHIADSLVVAGVPSELRDCKAIVPATVYAPDELDTRKIKRTKTGEFNYQDIVKHVWTPTIFGRVWDHWKLLNPDAKPALGFAPGVAESLWFAQQYEQRGVKAAHVDGDNLYVDGTTYDSDREARRQVLEEFRRGDIPIIWNRFVFREGIDLPYLYHAILATPFGSLLSYLQTVGRVLRYSPETPDGVIIQDHGGNWWRHGSPNIDRDWRQWFDKDVRIVTDFQHQQMREKKSPEPIVCPECKAVRSRGSVCPFCGHERKRKVRIVLQTDGRLKEMSGDIFRPRHIREKPNTQSLWRTMYFRARNSKNRMTFNQAEGLFYLENYYYPPRTLAYMPLQDVDWFMPVRDVPGNSVRGLTKETQREFC